MDIGNMIAMPTTKAQFAVPFLLLAAAFTDAAGADVSLLRQILPNVVKVEATNTDGSVSVGSGVVVGNGLVATNCHVTRRATAIVLESRGMRADVESEASDVAHDLCLLYVPAVLGQPVAAVASADAQTGQAVFAVGFAGGGPVRVSDGRIDAVFEYDGGELIETSAWFSAGSSGGGLFDDQGRLVGILSFMSRGPRARHYCLPASWAVRAAAHFVGRAVAPLSGLPFWQEEEERQPGFLRVTSGYPSREE
jgi:serine protease Do